MWSVGGVLHPEGHYEDAKGHSGAELNTPTASGRQDNPIAPVYERLGASGVETRDLPRV